MRGSDWERPFSSEAAMTTLQHSSLRVSARLVRSTRDKGNHCQQGQWKTTKDTNWVLCYNYARCSRLAEPSKQQDRDSSYLRVFCAFVI